jgi:hypothetical protein
MPSSNPEPAGPVSVDDSTRVFAPIATAILAALLLALVYSEGTRRGMDHMVAFGPEIDQVPIAIALSDVVYNLNAGYVGYTSVLKKLMDVWNGGAASPYDPIVLKNSSDRRVLNAAIAAASSLGPQQPGFISEHTLITGLYDDLGTIDFVKLAFRLFGLRIESRYYMFFLVFSISSAAYLVAFRSHMTAQLILL